ncbi:DUF72 domain-containing protein [Brevibacillus sp. SYP-B805]|uniref:DUF72 domain-containing protein n=1 Tax=Brevibacillus sp. SYP-B805 TaxID=1578199 RepID=UPI0013EA2339|nr:DUF72 domain-containing protein [Brevibacillus sp. SYP-B805]NGQ95287.1 DUF72 domain-containing protein [Brevibacillus sp. SYP-B805]
MAKSSIHVGLCGWGDHESLYPPGVRDREKLSVYASHFPLVEIDSSFYAILPQKNYETWVRETPESFRFVIKPHQAITGHQRGGQEEDRSELFRRFEESIQPVAASGKLAALLFQFPPWFDCTREHVRYIQRCAEAFSRYPVAVEFRHRSWFEAEYREKTLAFLRGLGAIHTVCDEPQAGVGCVPIVVAVTQPKLALVRFHGRNVKGWRDPGKGVNWRDVRYLYHYKEEELREWVPRVQELARQAEQVLVLFNNNSGKHAAGNAKEFMQMLGIQPSGLHPRQLELF